MENIQERMMDLRLKGYCCSQILMQMGLDQLGKENQDLIDASGGLCDGIYSGKTCGVLTAAVSLMYLADPEEASMTATADLVEWFEDAFGSSECAELMGDDINAARVNLCPMIVESTFQMVEELMDWD